MTSGAVGAQTLGYYRQPALNGDFIVFVSEGDLWKVPRGGGRATRLTSHVGDEGHPAFSPDGRTLAFTGRYEGSTEVYVVPITGGRPQRLTYGAGNVSFVGWTSQGKVLYATQRYAGLPSTQLVLATPPDTEQNQERRIPLAQDADGCYDDAGKTLFFTRLPFQGSHTKRYKGGTAQNLWRYTEGMKEAEPLTPDYPGTSKNPLWWKGRVYFVSDRDGTMNLWSMNPTGGDLKQHTRHAGWDVISPSLWDGKIVYQLGADIHLHDIAAQQSRKIDIVLDSDLDQTQERWLKKPFDYLSAAHLSPDGGKVALTARGKVFVVPHKDGRLVEVTPKGGVRHRDARFLPDGKALVTLSDQSGEVELWKFPANGVGPPEQLTNDGDVLRWQCLPSPDGKLIAHHDKNFRLFLYDVEKKSNKKIDESKVGDIEGMIWSPDSKWLAYVVPAGNFFRQIKLHNIAEADSFLVTSDRFDSFDPAWSMDGQWLYLLSDRHLKSVVPGPWGTYQPEPFLHKKTKIYQLALVDGLRSPFEPPDETTPTEKPKKKNEEKKDGPKPKLAEVKIDRVAAGLSQRLQAVPAPAGNYRNLRVNDKALFWMQSSIDGEAEGNRKLVALPIGTDPPEVKTLAQIESYDLSQDGKKLLLRKKDSLAIVDAVPVAADLSKNAVNLSSWSLSLTPREEWRQMFTEAWRLERDYFYDRGLHGIDWKAMHKKYEPLVARVHSRAELSDLLAQMVAELSALHIFVIGGDMREGSDKIGVATLGAVLEPDRATSALRIGHIYQHDPDEPELAGPLSRPGVNLKAGDLIYRINGQEVHFPSDVGRLLRNQAGQQVLLEVRHKPEAQAKEVIVKPISLAAEANLRYHEWETSRRMKVEELGKGDIGYFHLRAMGGGNFTEFAKGFYPVFTRQGLIIDVRNNQGGNIDSWILARLLRKAWFHWNQRVGQAPQWNMQYAFRGHIVVLCNEYTASDGEAFCEGIKRLGLGKVIGTRTWGGEIWLTSSNFLVDKGIATAAEFGVYGPEGAWLIEGHGVEPDIVVDNLPHATFRGEDAQLEAAIRYLQKQIKEKPIVVPPVPAFPNKSFPLKKASGLRLPSPFWVPREQGELFSTRSLGGKRTQELNTAPQKAIGRK
jgi:tricorn protease